MNVPKLRIAAATKTGLMPKQFDVLIDAGSLPWIHQGETGRFEPDVLTLERIIDEYARISSKAILVFDSKGMRYPGLAQVRNFLDTSGIRYKEHKVKNRYEIPLPKTRKRNYRHDYSYDHALVINFGARKLARPGLC